MDIHSANRNGQFIGSCFALAQSMINAVASNCASVAKGVLSSPSKTTMQARQRAASTRIRRNVLTDELLRDLCRDVDLVSQC